MLGGIDSRFTAKASDALALWQQEKTGVSVRAARSRRSFPKLAIAAACAAVIIGAFVIIMGFRKNSFSMPGFPGGSDLQSAGGSAADSVPTENDSKFKGFEAVDPFVSKISYMWDVESDRISYGTIIAEHDYSGINDGNAASLGYLKEFFGLEKYFVPEEHIGGWDRRRDTGQFYCHVPVGTDVFAPTGGIVISVAKDQELFGNAVAVEIPGGKIYVLSHLDEVRVRVGHPVTAGQLLGVTGTSGLTAGNPPRLGLVIMKKKSFLETPENTVYNEWDGLKLTVSTDKCTYNVGDMINLTATLENQTGKDIWLYYGSSTTGGSAELMPSFDGLIEFPIRGNLSRDCIITVIPFRNGEKLVQDFTFRTLTGYRTGGSENGEIEIYPNLLSPVDRTGIYKGTVKVQTVSDPESTGAEVSDYVLYFSVAVNAEQSAVEYPDDESAADGVPVRYTPGMLKDYFIYDGVLYTNCYTCPVTWVTEDSELDFSKVGEHVTTIKGKADPDQFEDDTANVLPAWTEIYDFPDFRGLLIARSGGEFIPYLKIVEG